MKYLFLLLLPGVLCAADDLYRLPAGSETRWFSFENPTGAPGNGGRDNAGAKGHPMELLVPGETKVLMDFAGTGVIRRIWMTLRPRTPAIMRSLRIDMTWDKAGAPAVSVPLGDFFGLGLGRRTPFENALFSDPEGRSFNCVIPMPFRTAARITVRNESDTAVDFFYDIDLELKKELPADALYFHAHWSHNGGTKLGEDFEILPVVHGRGRFLGTNLSIITDPRYGASGWCEGEVKMYLDGDTSHPTLNGTGTEDYIGSGWGQKVFVNRYQGCPVADEVAGQWAFYRYHVPDPVYFHGSCRVVIQQMGGEFRDMIRGCVAAGAPVKPVSVGGPSGLFKLLEMKAPPQLADAGFPDGWVTFYRLDNYTGTAYFYLDSPTNGLPSLAPVSRRVEGLPHGK